MADVNAVFFLSLSIIALGYLIKSLKIVTESEGKTLTSIVLNVTLPALIINTVTRIEIESQLALLPFICLIFSILVSVLSFILFRHQPNNKKGLLCMCVIGFNIGLFAYPLIEGIWGSEGLKYVALFDVGNAFIIFGLVYVIGAIFSPKNASENRKVDLKYIGKRLITSAPLMSYVIALILNFSNVEFSSFVSDFLDVLARANMGLVLLILGIYLNFKFEKSQWAEIGKILLIRYGCGLVVGFLLYFTLPFNQLYRGIVLISLNLPLGMAIIPFSVIFGFDEKLAGTTANLSIIISFSLMWILISVLGLG